MVQLHRGKWCLQRDGPVIGLPLSKMSIAAFTQHGEHIGENNGGLFE